jgi:hypothetical protein
MAKSGRKGLYEYWISKEGLLKVEGWARDGATDKIIAKKIGITPATVAEWKKRFPKFAESLKRGKEIVDREVENALLKSAKGYDYEEVESRLDKDTGEMVVVRRTVKHVPASTTAQIFWLKNRKPQDYREKQEVELSGKVDFNTIWGDVGERLVNADKQRADAADKGQDQKESI